jgi:hypothetical protein
MARGRGDVQWRVGGAVVVRPATVVVRACACGIVVVPVAAMAPWQRHDGEVDGAGLSHCLAATMRVKTLSS